MRRRMAERLFSPIPDAIRLVDKPASTLLPCPADPRHRKRHFTMRNAWGGSCEKPEGGGACGTERPVRTSVLKARPRSRAPSKKSVEGFGSPDSQRYTVQALNRAIDVLMAFSEQSPALALGEVSARTGLS